MLSFFPFHPLSAQSLSLEQGENLVTQAQAACQRAQYQKAENQYEQALDIFQKFRSLPKARFDAEITWIMTGECYREQHKLQEALNAFQQARTFSDDDRRVSSILVRIANVHSESGAYLKAIDSYQKALQALENINALRSREAAPIYRDLGTTYMRIGQYQEALYYAQQAYDLFTTLKDAQNAASVLTTLGGTYEALGDENWSYFFRSIDRYKQALTILQDTNYVREAGLALSNWGKTLQRLGKTTNQIRYYQYALVKYHKALEQYQAIPSRPFDLESRTWNNIGETHLALSTYEDQTEHLRQAHLRQALEALNKAKAIQEDLQDTFRLWVTLGNLGRVYEAQGKPERAIEQYRNAIDTYEDFIESSSSVETLTISLRDQLDATYQRLIRLLWDAGRREEAFFFSERARARAFLAQLSLRKKGLVLTPDSEALKAIKNNLRELEKKLRQERSRPPSEQPPERLAQLRYDIQKARERYGRIRQEEMSKQTQNLEHFNTFPARLDELKQHLDSRTTLLSFFVMPEKTLAFIVTHTTFKPEELQIGAVDLAEYIRKARRQPLDSTTVPPKELETLYAKLIAPLRQYLHTPTLGIIPHRMLHLLPFAALTPDRRHYFGEEHLLYVLPSATVFTQLPTRPIPPTASLLALAYGNAKELPPLFFVNDEVKAISDQYPTQKLLEKEATLSSFVRKAPDYSLLHLAAHGELHLENPLFSRIILADGDLTVEKIENLNLSNTALVVLSACNTNIGKRSRGDDIVGLTRAFMIAGAPSVIASLWPVNDRATADFMAAFYTSLKRTRCPAKALQKAQQTIRKTYPHPYYWAGFVLAGDPGNCSQDHPLIEALIALLAAAGIVMMLWLMKARGIAETQRHKALYG